MENKITIKYTITLDYEQIVDSDTGEVLETKCVNRKVSNSKEITPKKKISNESPMLFLEENKYRLNDAAIELMQVTSDDKIDIKYEPNGSIMIPIIGADRVYGTKGGNKLTKSNTVACKGTKREELIKYGDQFKIIPHTSKEGLFILQGNKELPKPVVTEEEISMPDDLDFSDFDFLDDAQEIDSSYFKL